MALIALTILLQPSTEG